MKCSRNYLVPASTALQVSQIITFLNLSRICRWRSRRVKDIIKENWYRIIIKLRSRRIVIAIKLDNVLITLHSIKKLLHCKSLSYDPRSVESFHTAYDLKMASEWPRLINLSSLACPNKAGINVFGATY